MMDGCASFHPKLPQIRNDFYASASPEERRSLDESFKK